MQHGRRSRRTASGSATTPTTARRWTRSKPRWAAATSEEDASPLLDKQVLILGAGGVARSIAFGLARRGASVTITNRHDERADPAGRGGRLPDRQLGGAGQHARRRDHQLHAGRHAPRTSTTRRCPPRRSAGRAWSSSTRSIIPRTRCCSSWPASAAARRSPASTCSSARRRMQFKLYTGQDAPVDVMRDGPPPQARADPRRMSADLAAMPRGGDWRWSAIEGPASRPSAGSWPSGWAGRSSMPIVELEARAGRSIRVDLRRGGRAGLPRLGGADARRADGGASGGGPRDRRRGRPPRGEPPTAPRRSASSSG